MTRWGFALTAAVLTAAVAPGCGLTGRLWQTMEDVPVRVRDASVTGDGRLLAATEYSDGRTWLLVGDEDGSFRVARREGPWAGALPHSVRPVRRTGDGMERDPRRDAQVWIDQRQDGPGRFERRLQWWNVDEGGRDPTFACPRPVDWSPGRSVPVILLTPLTFAVDVATAPLELVYVFLTIGHGGYLMPWNGVEVGVVGTTGGPER